MFKRELKVNLKNFIIWLLILIGIYTIVYLVYPSIVNNENIELMDEMMAMFPEEVLKAFNMDISSIDSVYGWLKSEGFTFILIIVGCYAGILGSNILLKEESDHTIEYLNSLPIKRSDIVIKKTLVGLIYVTAMVVLIGIFNYVGLSLSGEFDTKQYLLLSITPLFSSYVVYFGCLFVSTFTHKAKKMLGISLGVVILSYVLQILSSLSENVEFLKFFSVFTLADTRNVITNTAIDPLMIVLTIVLSSALFVFTLMRYNKKDLI